MQDPRYGRTLLALVLSGAAGLLYETVWAKQLGYAMGGTTLTISLILAAFMGGMALGSWLAGRWADRHPRCLVAYAQVEIALGVLGAVMPWLLWWTGQQYLGLAQGHEDQREVLLALRAVLFFALLSLPAVLMGATFPLACRGTLTAANQIGGRIPGVYAANSAGAVLGCLLTGFVLIPYLGLTASSLCGTLLNISAAMLALRAARMSHADETPAGAPATPEPALATPGPLVDGASNRGPVRLLRSLRVRARSPEPAAPPAPGTGREAIAGPDPFAEALPFHLLLSGFTAMAYEVAFTRTLPLVLGASTYAFTLMLAAFITGIARGAARLSALPGADARRVLAYAQVRLGSTILIALPLLSLVPFGYLLVKCKMRLPFELFSLMQLLLIFPVMAYPAYHLGMVIPCAARVLSDGLANVGTGIGRAYAANTVGNVLGSLAAGLFLIPGLSLHDTFVVMALFNIMSGFALGRFLRDGIPLRLWVASLVGMLGVLVWPEWHPVLRVGGAFRIPAAESNPFGVLVGSTRDTVIFQRDDPDTSVVVQFASHSFPPMRYLRVAGKVDASGGKDMHTQLLLAHVPLLLHPGARDVLVIGMGSGATAGAALAHPVERVDVAEISAGVIAAAPLFSEYNDRFWEDQRTRLVQDDARHHLGITARGYDVIISEPSNPWMAGIGNLYTREFFSTAASRMRDRGLFCQWIHTYEMSDEVLAMIVRTFQRVFPEVRGFLTGAGLDLLLIGSKKPIAPKLADVEAVFHAPRVEASLARLGITQAITPFLMEPFDAGQAIRFAGKGPLITDDHPRLEYDAPRAFYAGAIAYLPVGETLWSGEHLWKRFTRGRALTDAELAEALAYTKDIVPLEARGRWLEDARRRGIADARQIEELDKLARKVAREQEKR